jgi:hypothetical protein
MDKLKQLESFVSVATRGSLTAAANAEGVAPEYDELTTSVYNRYQHNLPVIKFIDKAFEGFPAPVKLEASIGELSLSSLLSVPTAFDRHLICSRIAL